MPSAEAFTTDRLFPAGVCPEEGESIIDDWTDPLYGSLILVRGFTKAEVLAILWNASKIKVTHAIEFAISGDLVDQAGTAWELEGEWEDESPGVNLAPSTTDTAVIPRERVCPRALYPDIYFFDEEEQPAAKAFQWLTETSVGAATIDQRVIAYDLLRILKQGEEYALVMFFVVYHLAVEQITPDPGVLNIDQVLCISRTVGASDGGDTVLDSFEATIFGKPVDLVLTNSFMTALGAWESITSITGTASLTVEVNESYTY
jgi:hypothetical protein